MVRNTRGGIRRPCQFLTWSSFLFTLCLGFRHVFVCFYCCSSVCDDANWTQASTPHLHFIAATPLWARPGHRHGKLEWRRATFQTDIWANHMAGFMQAVILGQSHSQIYACSYLGQSHCSIYKNISAKSHSYISFKMIFGPIRTTKLMIFGQLFC